MVTLKSYYSFFCKYVLLFNLFSTPMAEAYIFPLTESKEKPQNILTSSFFEIAETNRLGHEWLKLTFSRRYHRPIVITSPPTFNGKHPGVIRLQNMSNKTFEIRFQEWDYRKRDFGDEYHRQESASYIVLEEGRYTTADGTIWEVGSFEQGEVQSWVRGDFLSPFPAPPKLFLTVQSNNGKQAVSVIAEDITETSFSTTLLEEEASRSSHKQEKIGYLAIYNPNPPNMIVLNQQNIFFGLKSFSSRESWQNILGHFLLLQEETSLDRETEHKSETIDALKIGNLLLTQVTSQNDRETASLRQRQFRTLKTPLDESSFDHESLPLNRNRYWPVFSAIQGKSHSQRYTSVSVEGKLLRYWNDALIGRERFLSSSLWQDGGLSYQYSFLSKGEPFTISFTHQIDDVFYPGESSPRKTQGMTRSEVYFFENIGYVTIGSVFPKYDGNDPNIELIPALFVSKEGGLPNTWKYLGKLKGEIENVIQKQRLWTDGVSLTRAKNGIWRIYLNGIKGLSALESETLDGKWKFIRNADGMIRNLMLPYKNIVNIVFPHVLKVSAKEWHLWTSDAWPVNKIYHFSSEDGLNWLPYGQQPEISYQGQFLDGTIDPQYFRNIRAFVHPVRQTIVGLNNGFVSELPKGLQPQRRDDQ